MTERYKENSQYKTNLQTIANTFHAKYFSHICILSKIISHYLNSHLNSQKTLHLLLRICHAFRRQKLSITKFAFIVFCQQFKCNVF